MLAAPPATAARSASGPGARGLATAFLLLMTATFGLIVLGALVRAHEAGLACPDWPLCFGQVVPEFDLKVAFEWSHRAVAGSVALVFAGLGVALFREPVARRAGGRLYVFAAVLLAAQILLGALTVWQLLAEWTVTSHLVTGNAFNACLLWLALDLREAEAPPARAALSRAARVAFAATAVLGVAQIVLGGLVSSSFAGLACPEWPACNGGEWFPTFGGSVGLHLFHRLNGYAFCAALAVLAALGRGSGRFSRLSALALGLALLQVVVGVANVLLGLPVEVTGLHSALAAALVLTLTAVGREARLAPHAVRLQETP